MISIHGKSAKVIATGITLAMFNLATPTAMWQDIGRLAVSLVPEKAKAAKTRLLTKSELENLRGKDSGVDMNPYIAGQSKWGINYRGVDLLTGNFTFSATDLAFEGGYGVPVAITRTYSANTPDEGPLGRGWTLSVDLRTTAGGLLKGGGAPSRSMPVTFVEKPATARQPAIWENYPDDFITEGVVTEDAGGLQTVVQRDVDGYLSPPAWDKNKVDVVYAKRMFNGQLRSYIDNLTVTTPEGTVYYYDEFGYEPDPNLPGAPGMSSVMKISTVTDRHGNVTSYNYSTDYVLFDRWTDDVWERRLLSIDMPGGRGFDFIWTGNRITAISDGTRTVNYGYDPGVTQVTDVTLPGNYVTQYIYGQPDNYNPGPMLRKITDSRGQDTEILYAVGGTYTPPLDTGSSDDYLAGNVCAKVFFPNGSVLHFRNRLGVGSEAPIFLFGGDHRRRSGAALVLNGGEVDRILYVDAERYNLAGASVFQVNLQRFYEIDNHASDNIYDLYTQDLITSQSRIRRSPVDDTETRRRFAANTFQSDTGGIPFIEKAWVTTTTNYNYFGAPLRKEVKEQRFLFGSGPDENTKIIYYAYWGADKYYQQKAVRDPAGNISFTDYFTSTDSLGKGQVKAVYDEKHSDFLYPFDPNNPFPWRQNVAVTSGTPSAQFTYDNVGRPLTVVKRAPQGATVTTRTTYSDAPGTFGNATMVEEDFGGINRTTQTLDFDEVGRAIDVQDASGRVIRASYDDAGNVTLVRRTSGTPKDLARYTYGTQYPGNKGMLLTATDHVSNLRQEITYFPVDVGNLGERGQVQRTRELNIVLLNPEIYRVDYTYNTAGDRASTKYTTPNGITEYTYADHIGVGTTDDRRVFRTMTAVTNGGQGIQREQFHHSYDSAGRLVHSAFMQSPFVVGGFEQPYAAYPAGKRGHAYYLYDGGGRISDLYTLFGTYIDDPLTWNDERYDYTGITKQAYTYNNDTGLRTDAAYYDWNGTAWVQDRNETYGYDPLGQLTSANYGGESGAWDYDGAGNRSVPAGYSYDKLNRMTASPGGAVYQNDILGNRTWKNYGQSSVQRYVWDELGRLNSTCSTTQGAKYTYRVDGLRAKKVEGLTITWVDDESQQSAQQSSGHYDEIWAVNKPTTRYYYDGQMGFEEDYTVGQITPQKTVTRYALGARGIDGFETTLPDGTTKIAVYPVYDGHGNMIATLKRNLNLPYYDRIDDRKYGAWGEIRAGSGPQQGYVANLGHRRDAESGLTYMRARYYEPGTGRFISEDPAMDGWNWYVYASGNPVNLVDFSGKFDVHFGAGGGFFFAVGWTLLTSAIITATYAKDVASVTLAVQFAQAGVASLAIASVWSDISPASKAGSAAMALVLELILLRGINKMMAQQATALAAGSRTAAANAVILCTAYSWYVQSLLLGLDIQDVMSPFPLG
ncbi:MAG: RHS repeat-associated core domain-containing protein [Armatimonadetes bacterium]|nr:RHS repeat-associated core domain-containing protein [Armatimonadota bacterium]